MKLKRRYFHFYFLSQIKNECLNGLLSNYPIVICSYCVVTGIFVSRLLFKLHQDERGCWMFVCNIDVIS